MIDISNQKNPRYNLHGLSGNILMTVDPAKAASASPQSMRKAASSFQANQPSFQFDNDSYAYAKSVPVMSEAAHALTSNFDFEALHTMVADPNYARRKAALDVIVDSVSPSGNQGPGLSVGPKGNTL